MKKILDYLLKACEESPGVPSCTRIVVMFGSAILLFTICGMWILACLYERKLAEIPASVGTTLGSYLAGLLAAKVTQSNIENKTP